MIGTATPMLELFDRGGPVMWPLLACSVLSLTVILERVARYWFHRRRRDEGLLQRVVEAAASGRLDAAAEIARRSRDPAANVLAAGLKHHPTGLTEAMQLAGAEATRTLRRGLGVLDTIVTVAPMLGILGTVLGIIESFDLLGEAGVQHPRAVVGGIAQALITTAAGLVVAVLTLLPHNGFVGLVRDEVARIEAWGTRLEIACRKADASAGGRPCD